MVLHESVITVLAEVSEVLRTGMDSIIVQADLVLVCDQVDV